MGRKGGGSKWFRGPVEIGRRGEMGEYGDPLARIAQDTLGFRAQKKWTAWPAGKERTISNKLHLPCRISRAVRCTEVRCVVGETHKPEETASSDGMLTGREKQVGLDGLGVPTQAREIREKSRLNQACRKSRLTWMGVPGWAE